MATRRDLLLALAALLLGGCGFRPMLKQVNDTRVQGELAAIDVKTSTGRVGYLVRDTLLDQLNPAGVQVPNRYELQISLTQRSDALAIQLDNTATRYNLTLTARFRLVDTASQQVLYSSVVHRVASYNAIQDPYAQLAAELAAQKNAAREVGTDIRTQLAIHFVRQSEAT
jgi:LPS-assembly lipoprotein